MGGLAGDRLRYAEQVLDTMPEFAEEHVLYRILTTAFGRIDDDQQHRLTAKVRMLQLASRHQHRPSAKIGELVLDLIVDDGGGLGDHLDEQVTQFRDIPLAAAQIIDAMPDGLLAIDLERLKEGTAGTLDAKIFVQHEKRIGNGIDDALRLHVAHSQKAVKVFHIHHERPGPGRRSCSFLTVLATERRSVTCWGPLQVKLIPMPATALPA